MTNLNNQKLQNKKNGSVKKRKALYYYALKFDF